MGIRKMLGLEKDLDAAQEETAHSIEELEKVKQRQLSIARRLERLKMETRLVRRDVDGEK